MVKRIAYALMMLGLVLAQPTSAKATPAVPLSCGGEGAVECWWFNPEWICYDNGWWDQLCNPKKYPACGKNGWPE